MRDWDSIFKEACALAERTLPESKRVHLLKEAKKLKSRSSARHAVGVLLQWVSEDALVGGHP